MCKTWHMLMCLLTSHSIGVITPMTEQNKVVRAINSVSDALLQAMEQAGDTGQDFDGRITVHVDTIDVLVEHIASLQELVLMETTLDVRERILNSLCA